MGCAGGSELPARGESENGTTGNDNPEGGCGKLGNLHSLEILAILLVLTRLEKMMRFDSFTQSGQFAMVDERYLMGDQPERGDDTPSEVRRGKKPGREVTHTSEGELTQFGVIVLFSQIVAKPAPPELVELVAANVAEFEGIDNHEKHNIPVTDWDTAKEGLALVKAAEVEKKRRARHYQTRQWAMDIAKQSVDAAAKLYGTDSIYYRDAKKHLDNLISSQG